VNRLRDEMGQGPIHDKGIDLIRRTPGTPADAELKRRVWAAVKDAEPSSSRARRWIPVRSFAVGGVVICLCGSAAAMIGRHWVWPRAAEITPPPPVVAPYIAAPAPRATAPAVAPAPTPPETAPAAPAIPSARPRPLHAAPQRAKIELTPAAAATAERTQVLDAMVALRRDHDAPRAGHLLDQYLTTHPHGALREEALVLAIEAATARGDSATARHLAAVYADGYPSGRFREFARETLGASTP